MVRQQLEEDISEAINISKTPVRQGHMEHRRKLSKIRSLDALHSWPAPLLILLCPRVTALGRSQQSIASSPTALTTKNPSRLKVLERR